MKKLNQVQAACLQAAALLACSAALSTAQAQSSPQVASTAEAPEIIVTASRSEQLLQTAPVGATVITRAQIESAGVVDANEAIRKIGGVAGKTDLNGGREFALDLRGFGETANNNLVVLVDGIRLTENEQTPARLSSIAANAIERIEILRGGSSVMWGEGATAGVINVITRQDSKVGVSGQIGVGVSSFIGRDLDAMLRVGSQSGKGVFDLALHSDSTSGYRENSRSSQDVASLGLSVREGDLKVRARLHTETSMARLPGSLTQTQFLQNPRQADPTQIDNWASLKQTRVSTGLDYKINDWSIVVDMGIKNRTSLSNSGGIANRNSTLTQLTPRGLYQSNIGSIALTTTVGLDVNQWRYSDASSRYGQQNNNALFVMSDWLLPSDTRVVAGYRSERIAKSINDAAVIPLSNKLSAAEASVNQTLTKGLDVYGRAAQSYRIANLDEFTWTNSNVPLRPQTSRDVEVGVKYRQAGSSLTARYFTQSTVDEIATGPNGANLNSSTQNINMDPTQRKGFELQGTWQSSPVVVLSATLQNMQATFSSGLYAGKRIPLVSQQNAVVRATYRVSDKQSVDTSLRMTGDSYPWADFSNTCSTKTPSTRLLDSQYRFHEKAIEVSLGVTNLTNVQSYTFNYGCISTPSTGSIYSDPGRALRATLKYNF
jgi:iron complex outermembrane recepter protein